jgi:lysophospholipid acyltransferase (LPLAT)-like uncharacterized protein
MYSLYDRVTGNALALLNKIQRYTCRKQIVGMEHLQQALDSDRPVIASAWHGKASMIVAILLYYVDPSSFNAIMPNDWRGGSLAVATSKLGAKPLPLDLSGDSTLGMGRVMVRFVRRIKAGENTIIAPDGPDGPAYVPKPGIAYIARKANALIVPVGGYCRHAYHLNRWDHYTVPLPFSRVSIHIGEPFGVTADQTNADITEHLTNILHRVTAQAAANYYAH